MNILITIIFTVGFNLLSFAQIDFENPPWKIDCDSSTTQVEMNICCLEKLQISDSILNFYYDKLIVCVDSQYKNELIKLKDTSDTLQKDYLTQLIQLKKKIIQSRVDFNKYLYSTTEIIDVRYKGASIRPLVVYIYAIDLTVNQIKIITNLIEDIKDR